MKKQLKQLKNLIEKIENDPALSLQYSNEDLRYMKSRYRNLRGYIQHANKLQKNGFGYNPEPVVKNTDGPED